MSHDYPFGNPEGARSSFSDLEDQFIPFEGDGLTTGSQMDLSIRVIVGAKGSGKTVYLRRLQAAATEEKSVFSAEIESDPPSTDQIVKFCSYFSNQVLTEKWSQLWHLAILRSIASHMCCGRNYASEIEEEQRESLKEYSSFLGLPRTPVGIYASAAFLIRSENSEFKLTSLLEDPRIDEIEYFVSQILRNTPPLFLFLDGMDENFRAAPMHWLRCQKGLVLRIMQLLRDQRFGGRLHVVTTCRDHVLSSLYTGEHQNRFRGEPHIRLLKWNYDAVHNFLRQKIELLPPEYFLADGEKSVATWLGLENIRNGGRDLREEISSYLIRHTRLLPRDIVQIGNALSSEVIRAHARDDKQISEDRVRQIVSELAASFGTEQLEICVTQIRSSSMPASAGQKGYIDYYTGEDEYRNIEFSELKELIMMIGQDEFSPADFAAARDEARQIFGRSSDVFSVLWQNRLLGCRRLSAGKERIYFFTEEFLDSFSVPEDATSYLFHPCVIDSVGIKSTIADPIRWGKSS